MKNAYIALINSIVVLRHAELFAVPRRTITFVSPTSNIGGMNGIGTSFRATVVVDSEDDFVIGTVETWSVDDDIDCIGVSDRGQIDFINLLRYDKTLL